MERIQQRFGRLDRLWPELRALASQFAAVAREDNRASNLALKAQAEDLRSAAEEVIELADDVVRFSDLGIDDDWSG